MEEIYVLDGKMVLKPYGDSYNGKHNGWVYQFLNNDYKGYHLGVCCKDFLQDIVWSEITGKTMSIYNQLSTCNNIINTQDRILLCIYRKDNQLLNEELLSNLQSFINDIEIYRGFYLDDLTLIELIDNCFVLNFSKKWLEKPIIFSFYTLICRLGVYYNGDLNEYLKNISDSSFYENKNLLDNCDLYYLKSNNTIIKLFIENKLKINQKNWNEMSEPSEVHGSGFFSNLYLLDYEIN